LTALLKHMGVNHRRGNVVVPQQLLNRANVGPALEQVGREGVTKSVGANHFGYGET
jgi:hypothetical protein